MSKLPWRPNGIPHDPTAEICMCDTCELPRYEAWANEIDAQSTGPGLGMTLLLVVLAVTGILIVILL